MSPPCYQLAFSWIKLEEKKYYFPTSPLLLSQPFSTLQHHLEQNTLLFLVASFPFIMFAQSLLFVLFPALEADLVSREKRGRVTAVLMLLSSVAGSAGQALGGIMYEQSNQRFPFLILGVFATLGFFITFLWVREPTKREA